MNTKSYLILGLVSAVWIGGAAAKPKSSLNAVSASSWTIVDLTATTTLSNAQATSINNKNEIAGTAGESPTVVGLIWKKLEPNIMIPSGENVISDINDRGDCAFSTLEEVPDLGSVFMPQYYRNKHIRDLGFTPLGGFANGLNDRGDVVGEMQVDVGDNVLTVPVLWDGGNQIELPILAGSDFGSALRISDDGEILGNVTWPLETYPDLGMLGHAVRWVDGVMEELPLAFDKIASGAYDMNGDGAAVGLAYDAFFSSTACLWRGNTVTELVLDLESHGTSAALGINNNQDVVGYTALDGAVLWVSATGEMVVLSQLPEVQAAGWSVLQEAFGISDDGWIIGRGYRTDTGEYHSFVLIPGR